MEFKAIFIINTHRGLELCENACIYALGVQRVKGGLSSHEVHEHTVERTIPTNSPQSLTATKDLKLNKQPYTVC